MTHRRDSEIDWVPVGDEHFTGEVWFGPLHSPVDPADLAVLAVRFAAGARSDWHSHPGGQVLYIVAGQARSAEAGGDLITAGPGDAIHTAPDVVHWHGAGPDGAMTHLSITHGGPTAWLPEKVTDEQYGAADL